MSAYPNLNIGDVIRGSRVVYDEIVEMEGTVIGIDRFTASDGKGGRVHLANIEIREKNGNRDWVGDLIEIIKPYKPEPLKPNEVNCWECGGRVLVSQCEYDGNGWYCGC